MFLVLILIDCGSYTFGIRVSGCANIGVVAIQQIIVPLKRNF